MQSLRLCCFLLVSSVSDGLSHLVIITDAPQKWGSLKCGQLCFIWGNYKVLRFSLISFPGSEVTLPSDKAFTKFLVSFQMHHPFRPRVGGDSHSHPPHSTLIMWDTVQQPSCCFCALIMRNLWVNYSSWCVITDIGHGCTAVVLATATAHELKNSFWTHRQIKTLMLCLHVEKYMHIVISVLLPIRMNL